MLTGDFYEELMSDKPLEAYPTYDDSFEFSFPVEMVPEGTVEIWGSTPQSDNQKNRAYTPDNMS